MVACQPGITEVAKSKLTMVWTETTSGVARAAEQVVGLAVVEPVPHRASPAHGAHAEEETCTTLFDARSRMVARSGMSPRNQNRIDVRA